MSTSKQTNSKTKITMTSSSSNSLAQLIVDREHASKPLGISLFGFCFRFKSQASKRTYHQALVLLLTFVAYAAFHMGRRPLSVVKNVLNRDCSRVKPKNLSALIDEEAAASTYLVSDWGTGSYPQAPTANDVILEPLAILDYEDPATTTRAPPLYSAVGRSAGLSEQLQPTALVAKDTSCDWAPFNDDATANKLLAYLDTSFLLSYAIFMFFSGFVAERVNLRYFISLGALVSGLGLIAFGLSYSLDIHSMAYFVLVQIISGAAQTTGWPVVVTCVSNWFDRSKLGTIYGLWNSHTNLGNILGATIAGYYVESDWGLSFIVPGVLMLLVGLLQFLFLVPTPADVELGAESSPDLEAAGETTGLESSPKVVGKTGSGPQPPPSELPTLPTLDSGTMTEFKQGQLEGKSGTKAISFMKALRIPGVIEYSFCLFFSKLVSYTFLYWLPRYITSSTKFNSQDSAYLSVPFDVGGIAGSILAGWLSDRFKANGIICNIMLLLAIPSMFIYQQFGALSSWHNILLQLLVGSLVNGPYCLITTAVSADLGNRIKDGRAMATVSAIIDGMGSVGAVLGPLFAGFVSSNDWRSVFLMLMAADVLASLCIVRVTVQDVRTKLSKSHSDVGSSPASQSARA